MGAVFSLAGCKVEETTITGRMLYADSEEPVKNMAVWVTNRNGEIETDKDGYFVNPTGTTDSTGRFRIEIPEVFLEDRGV